MKEVSLFKQDIGIASIEKLDAGRVAMPAQSEAQNLVGGKIKQTLRSLYDQVTIMDIAVGLTVPTMMDTELQRPHKFHAALREVVDKIEAYIVESPGSPGPDDALSENADSYATTARRALAHTQKVDAAQKQYGYNVSALSMA